jgi:hypothetical protein
MLDAVSFLGINLHFMLFNQKLSPLVDLCIGAIFPIIAFDFLPTDSFYEQYEPFTFTPLSTRFSAFGYESGQILQNLGSLFVYKMGFFLGGIFLMVYQLVQAPFGQDSCKKQNEWVT